MAVPEFIGVPPGVDPMAELAVRSFLIERYNEQLKNPLSTARGKLPVLALTPSDIVNWEVLEEFDAIRHVAVIKLQILDHRLDHTKRQQGIVHKVAWQEASVTVIDTLSMLTGVRNGQMDRNFNPINPMSLPKVNENRSTQLRIQHRISLVSDISSPLAKKAKNLPWEAPMSTMAFTCSCTAGFFCKVVRDKITGTKLPEEITSILNDITHSIEIALPIFGCVLHRVHIRLERERNNWDDALTWRLELSQLDYMYRYSIQFFEVFEGISEGPNLLSIAIRNLESLIKNQNEAQTKIKDTLAFINGEASIICKHTQASKPGKPATHNFGTNRHLLQWHKEFFPDAQEFGERVMANAHCQLTYGECYWCYRNNDLALVMPTL